MDDRICNEYTAGFCTRQAFYDSRLTQKCEKLHDNGKKCAYDEHTVYGYEMGVYKTYRGILMEMERKAKNKNGILMNLRKFHDNIADKNGENEHKIANDDPKSTGHNTLNEYKIGDIMNILDKLHDKLIRNLKLSTFDLSLHQIYGQLMVYLINSKPVPSNFFVCEVCANLVVKTERCEHPFHKEYEKLRVVTEKLSKKLNQTIVR